MKCIECNEIEANKGSGLCDVCERKEEGKINGLLYLPALGIIFSLIYGLWGFYKVVPYLIITFQETTSISGQAVCVFLFMIVNIIIAFLTACFFFKRRKNIKQIMVFYYFLGFLSSLFLVFLLSKIYNVNIMKIDLRILFSSFIGVVVWIPYFLLSKRIPVVFNK